MHSIHFIGKVLPSPTQVTIHCSLKIRWEAQNIGTIEFTCKIINSNIDVECSMENYRSEYFDECYRRALDICRAQVDLVAFKKGWGLTATLDKLIDQEGDSYEIFQNDERLATICTAFSLDQGFDEICAKVIGNVPLFMALRDLISSISLPHVAPVDCARAMDRLKHLIATPGASDKQAWREFRQALQIDEKYIKFITKNSTNPRHGKPDFISGEITAEVTQRAWKIMNRYFEYVKRGYIALDPSEFPILID